jgi:hypothetical protein
MSYYLDVIKDNPIAFLPLDESAFTSANDISGCGNHGSYNGTFSNKIMPLIYGGSNATKITSDSYIQYSIANDYAGNTSSGGLALKQYSDNDFSLEIWFKPNIASSNLVTLLADEANSIGLFYKQGSIIFKVQSEEIFYKLSFSKKAMHIVAKYSVNSIELYVDGNLVKSKPLTSFRFTNASVLFKSGPTSGSDTFLIDAPAIYRYGLNKNKIKAHHISGLRHINPIQVVSPDNGLLVPLTGQTLTPIFKYEYDTEKKWKAIINDSVYYDSANAFISFPQTVESQAATFNGYDIINIPNSIDIFSSKVEWRGDNGVSVFTSIDGTTYEECTNGSYIPQFSKELLNVSSQLYIKVSMSSSDTSVDLPRLSMLNFYFYSDKKLYAQNYGCSADSNKEYDISLFNYPVLLRHPNVGVKTIGTGGFDVAIDQEIKSIEFMFTPSTTDNNIVFYSAESGIYPETKFGWNGTGTLKTNISKVYLNGQDVTSSNFKNQLSVGEPHHIVLTFTDVIKNTFQFNYLSSSNYGPSCNYHNLGLYLEELVGSKVLEHYNLYVGRPSYMAEDSSFSLTESTVKYYNNEWIVVSSN